MNLSAEKNKKALTERYHLSRTNKHNAQSVLVIRGATLIHGKSHALSKIPAYPRQLTYAITLQNTQWDSLLITHL